MSKLRIAALITVYNRKDTTLKCLEQLHFQHIHPDCQIDVWLTDDGCTDGTPQAVRSTYPSVHIVNGDGNLYWNRGMHRAWMEATAYYDYDFYLWLNDDTHLVSGAIQHLLDISNKKDNKSIIVGYTIDSIGKNITYGGRDKKMNLVTIITDITPCHTFNGNTVLIPRHAYKIVGTNDPFFHHGIGDSDYGLRAKAKGIDSFIAPLAVGTCNAHTNLPTWANPNSSFLKRLKALYAPGGNGSNPIEFFVFNKRHNGLLKACIYFISNHLHAIFPYLWKRDASKY